MPTPRAYYNEFDVKAADWLRELIKAGHIAPGDVDDRSIADVAAADIKGYTQCHFFAGIGGWSYALRLAGWPDDRPVWTGSCPCQPFSAAGKGKGFADERHLWPAFFHLIRAVRPQHIFGEQVANCLPWLDLVQADLEAEDYASGAIIMGAHSVGAPHIRQRLYWVADADGRNAGTQREQRSGQHGQQSQNDSTIDRLADGNRPRLEIGSTHKQCAKGFAPVESRSNISELAESPRQSRCWRGDSGRRRRELADSRNIRVDWSRAEFIPCTDGKARPIEPGTFPLAHGVPGRVGLLRGYGNAIVPQVAAEFIGAYLGIVG